jgi:O-acetyl-ADP-ribose deacetylase (regulator of RNase III)
MVYFIEFGDIFSVEGVNNYAHGCNCAGAMGKGIAVQFRQMFPRMYDKYKELCKQQQFTVGDVFTWQYENGYVFNLGTQVNWRAKARLQPVLTALEKMLQSAAGLHVNKIALPKIGAGLGGLDWQEVRAGIIQLSEIFPQVDLFVVENFAGDGL